MADPYAEVRRILREALQTDPSPLLTWPDPDQGGTREPPVEIWLDAWAVAWARRLHDAAGKKVMLMVGAKRYPPERPAPVLTRKELRAAQRLGRQDQRDQARSPQRAAPPAMTVTWQVPTIGSGHSLVHTVLVHNDTDADVALETNGWLEARIVDAAGREVGRDVGPTIQPLVVFTVPARGSAEVPVIVGTAATVPDYDYGLPPGEWEAQVRLETSGAEPQWHGPLTVVVS